MNSCRGWIFCRGVGYGKSWFCAGVANVKKKTRFSEYVGTVKDCTETDDIIDILFFFHCGRPQVDITENDFS